MNDLLIPPQHPEFRHYVEYVGNEKQPVLIVDNFLEGAEALVEFATRFCRFSPGTHFYPGIQSKVPPFYIHAMYFYLRDIISSTFDIEPQDISELRSMFSMVLTKPDQLTAPQSRPHVDSTARSQLATVHYLCTADKGGTSLYRHKATGYEVLDDIRLDKLSNFLVTEEKDAEWQKKYINGSNKYYEQIASYEASFNRLIMYRSNCLHSATIPMDFNFDPNPATGRLTLNTFISCNEATAAKN